MPRLESGLVQREIPIVWSRYGWFSARSKTGLFTPVGRGARCAYLLVMPSTMLAQKQDESVRAVLADHKRRESDRRDAIRRIEADYREMPGLSVTLSQGCRLWSLPPDLCASILEQMIASSQLKRRGDQYSLR